MSQHDGGVEKFRLVFNQSVHRFAFIHAGEFFNLEPALFEKAQRGVKVLKSRGGGVRFSSSSSFFFFGPEVRPDGDAHVRRIRQ